MNKTSPASVRPFWLKIPASVVHAGRAAWQSMLRDWSSEFNLAEYNRAFPDISTNDMRRIRSVDGLTMTSIERRHAVLQAIRYVVRHKIEGAVVECGVWHGGSSMLAAIELLELGDITRDLYLFDTFEGMTPPTDLDRDFDGTPAYERMKADAARQDESKMWCISSLENVRKNMLSTRYEASRLHFIKGRVEETIPDEAPARISLLRLDTDWYESTRHELMHLYDRVAPGGVIIIDDYGYWQGARKAVDEFLDSCADPLFLQRIDDTARLLIKPAP